jgi:hypothetical protein
MPSLTIIVEYGDVEATKPCYLRSFALRSA